MADYIVADVNGRRLMRSELEEQMRRYLNSLGSRELTSTDWPFIYQAVLEQYAIEQQLTKEVQESGITISDAEADQAMKEYADSSFPTREAFYQYLELNGTKREDYKKNIAQQMARQRWITDSIGLVTISEDEAVKFYDDMKNFFFRQPAGFMINLAHFTSADSAEKLRSDLLEGYSWDEATSGDMVASSDVISMTPTPILVPESAFDSYLAPMQSFDIGVVGAVFEVSSNDFALGVKTESVEEKISSYDEVSSDIRAVMQQQKEREALNEFTQGLLNRAKIVIRDESLFPSQSSEVLPVTNAPLTPAEPLSADAGEPVVPASLDVISGD
jgi:hypothetical protein